MRCTFLTSFKALEVWIMFCVLTFDCKWRNVQRYLKSRVMLSLQNDACVPIMKRRILIWWEFCYGCVYSCTLKIYVLSEFCDYTYWDISQRLRLTSSFLHAYCKIYFALQTSFQTVCSEVHFVLIFRNQYEFTLRRKKGFQKFKRKLDRQ
jgi:hypothetical protein